MSAEKVMTILMIIIYIVRQTLI